MSWTSPKTWAAGDVLGAAEMNTYVRDNESFLLSGFAMSQVIYEAASDYTTTSATFVDVDATNLILTLNVLGGRALIRASCWLKADNTASSSAELDIIVDSTTRKGGTNGLARVAQNGSSFVSVEALFTGLSVGSHTFKLQFRNVTGGATTTIGKAGNTGTTTGSPIILTGEAR